MGILLWLSLAPRLPTIPVPALSSDKLHHSAAYCVLTLLACRAFAPLLPPGVKVRLAAFFFAFCFGGLVEMAQGLLTTVRSASVLDLLANTIGALAALLIAPLLFRPPRAKTAGGFTAPRPLGEEKKVS
ncbi:MAG: VanZ family protein [Desulfuromonadaceae bacterium]|nr:VanZ family protein [Desulfuromonadaceae bacterium]